MLYTVLFLLVFCGSTKGFLTGTTTLASTNATEPTTCFVCSGPPFICEQRFHSEKCGSVSQQYCINEMVNNRDGTRTLNRKCATQAECEKEWWTDTADRTECTGYDVNGAYAYTFKCNYCCQGPSCNRLIIPSVLYQGTGPKGRKK